MNNKKIITSYIIENGEIKTLTLPADTTCKLYTGFGVQPDANVLACDSSKELL